jgi:hypothetical protein
MAPVCPSTRISSHADANWYSRKTQPWKFPLGRENPHSRQNHSRYRRTLPGGWPTVVSCVCPAGMQRVGLLRMVAPRLARRSLGLVSLLAPETRRRVNTPTCNVFFVKFPHSTLPRLDKLLNLWYCYPNMVVRLCIPGQQQSSPSRPTLSTAPRTAISVKITSLRHPAS